MPSGFDQPTLQSAEQLLEAALQEDLADAGDLTCLATLPQQQTSAVQLVSRESGVFCGGQLIELTFSRLRADVQTELFIGDGAALTPGTVIAEMRGDVRSLLIGERTILNFLTHLCGISSLTAKYVRETAGTHAVVLDTRKTLPGWRRLQKYAVLCGGATNHRMGLFDGVLIKDNHLAARGSLSAATAVESARDFLRSRQLPAVVEIEVDTLDQLRDVLTAAPEIVLLDNMQLTDLIAAVELRNQFSPQTLLEASGGVSLATIREIARTGVDRISVGGLTHSAPALDLGFDWSSHPGSDARA